VFLFEQSLEMNLAVVSMGPPSSDADWTAYLQALDEMNRTASVTARPVLAQVLRSPSVPSATVRRAIGAFRERIRPDVINVVISDSITVRHVQTALDWLHKPHYDSTVHATSESGLAHVERLLGPSGWAERGPTLRRLVAAIERRMGQPQPERR
jgi:hypothetical protein